MYVRAGRPPSPQPSVASSPSPRQRAKERTRFFLAAMESRQDKRACAMMTPRLQRGISFFLERNLEPGNGHTRAAHIYSMAKAPGHPDTEITTVTLVGKGAASAKVTAPGGVESEVELRKVDGLWLIADF